MKQYVLGFIAVIFILTLATPFFADDQEFFTYYVTPDVWIILDTSGSMEWDMNGCPTYGDGDAVIDKRGRDTDGDGIANDSRMYLVKQAIHMMVADPEIDIRWGLSSYYQTEYSGNSDSHYRVPNSGHSYPVWSDCVPWWSSSYWHIPNLWWHGSTRTYAYQAFLQRVVMAEASSAHTNEILSWVDCNSSSAGKKELRAQGGTPIAGALRGVRYEYESTIASDNAKWCRGYYVILLTDGEPTYGIDQATYNQGKNAKWSGDGNSSPQWMKDQCKWEAESLMTAHIPAQGGDTAMTVQIKTYVIGVGNDVGAPTLDSIAARGGTEHYYPATDPSELQQALEEIVSDIISRATSYSGSEVTSIQEEFITTNYEARMYVCSFVPAYTSIWEGHMKAIKLVEGSWNIDSIPDSLIYWDAGDSLLSRNAGTRQIYTQKANVWTPFNAANITPADLGVATAGARDSIVNTVYSGRPGGTHGYLSDIFHSSPLRIFGPNYFYEDDDFFKYRNEMDTTREPMIYAGSNDGMLHCFRDSTGEEMWSFIANDQLKNLKYLLTEHRYFMDANAMAADIWFPTTATDSFKNSNEWKTILITGERQGGRAYSALDVTDPNNPDFMFAFDTTMLNLGETWSDPVMFKVHRDSLKSKNDRFFGFFGGGYWQDTLYDVYNPPDSVPRVPGSGIYVFDVYNMCSHHPPTLGTDYWKIPPNPAGESMLYPFPSQVSVIDTNLDTYADMFYIGDWAGQLWKVKMNVQGDSSSVIINNWEANVIFKAPKPSAANEDYLWQPIFFPVTQAWDGRRWWLFFGTGDRANASKDDTKNRFYAIIDGDYDPPITEADLKHVPADGPLTEPEIIGPPNYKGWYLEYADFDNTDSIGNRDGEKTTSYAIVIMDTLVFTTFQPHDNNNPCLTASGVGRLYKIYYKTGSYGTATPSRIIGSGLPQAPRYSFSISGEGLEIINLPGQVIVQQTPNIGIRRKLLWWQEIH